VIFRVLLGDWAIRSYVLVGDVELEPMCVDVADGNGKFTCVSLKPSKARPPGNSCRDTQLMT
jgi:hypothetical protein